MRCVIVRHASLIIAATSLVLTCAAQTISTVPESVERYARDINAAISSSGPLSLEKAFEEGLSAAEALEHGQLDRLDEPTFQKVKRLMIGFWVNRMEVISADPDPSIFVQLAHEKGTKVDQSFFEVLMKTYPDPKSWAPVYIEPKTDWGGCTVFEGKTLSGTYGWWTSFQKAYPSSYRVAVQKELTLIQSALESECVCGGEDEYLKELQIFVKTYPTSPFVPGVVSRLEAVKKKTFKIRFHWEPQG
jgi:hypothetical protein